MLIKNILKNNIQFCFELKIPTIAVYNKNATKRIIKVAQRALIGWNLTNGAWKKIGKITKKDDHSLKAIGLDKKVLFKRPNSPSYLGCKLSLASKFFVINSSNALSLIQNFELIYI